MPKTPLDSMPDLHPPEGYVVGVPGERGFYVEESMAHREQATHQNVREAIGTLSAKHAAHLVAGFHGAESSYFGRPLDKPNTVNSIITRLDETGHPTNEIIGQGANAEASLYDAWLGMRKLETAHTKPLLRMHMDSRTAVDFTSLEHYAPKIAPGLEPYTVPGHVAKTVEGNDRGRHTYDKTIATEGWDKQLFGQVTRFATSERGAALVKNLKIHSLRALTPEQAVKLTLSMVQDVFKYSRDAEGKPAGEAADEMTAIQLIEEGSKHKDDPNWQGNGVCRNIASTVKAVFEAVKANQGDLNMLHNTYVGYTGSDEDFRINKRQNAGVSILKEPEPGHAWNTFATVDSAGNASVTVADVTWALEHTPEDALQNMDYTLTRSARTARELFNQSQDKATSFHELNDYYKDFLRNGLLKHRSTTTEFDDMTQFIMHEYLEAAAVALRDADGRHEEPMLPLAPGYILGAAYRLGDNLGKDEIMTLYRLEAAGAYDTFDTIAQSYARGGKNTVVGDFTQHRATSLTFKNDALQQKIFSYLPADKIREYADADSGFRVRVRAFMPDVLPAFDPTNLMDQRALAGLAKQNGIQVLVAGVQSIDRSVKRQFLEAADGRQELVDRVIHGRDLYNQVKDYRQILEELSRTRQRP